MLEIILGIVAIAFVVKVANEDDKLNPTIWGLVTAFAVIAGFFLVPIPFLRVLGAALVVFITMIAYKAKVGA